MINFCQFFAEYCLTKKTVFYIFGSKKTFYTYCVQLELQILKKKWTCFFCRKPSCIACMLYSFYIDQTKTNSVPQLQTWVKIQRMLMSGEDFLEYYLFHYCCGTQSLFCVSLALHVFLKLLVYLLNEMNCRLKTVQGHDLQDGYIK